MSNQLFIANVKKDEQALDIVIKHMTALRDTWREAIRKFKTSGNTLADYEIEKSNHTKSSEYEEDDEDDEDASIGEYIV